MTMKRITAAAIAALGLAMTAQANAAAIEVDFAGIVGGDQPTTIIPTAGVTTADSGYHDGQAIAGSFIYDTTTSAYTRFTLGTFSVPLTNSFFGETPGNDTLTYAVGPTTGTTTLADRLTLTLSALTAFSSPTFGTGFGVPPVGQIDLANSVADLLIQRANGTQTRVEAVLTSVSVVPEPTSVVLMTSALVGLAGLRRRR